MSSTETPAPPSEAARKTRWQITKDFSKEIWHDNDFWIRAFAVKGGASAIIIACVVALGQVVALPFLLAAGAVVACVGLIGVALGSILIGLPRMWDRIRQTHQKVSSPDQKPVVIKSTFQKWAESPRFKKLMEKPVMQKLKSTHAWKMTRKLGKKQEELFLAGMAGGGSIVTFVGGVFIVTTNVVTFSLMAIPFAAIATAMFVSGIFGAKISTKKIFSFRKEKKEKQNKLTAENAPAPAPAPTVTPAPQEAAAPALKQNFDDKAAAKTEKAPAAKPPKQEWDDFPDLPPKA